VVDQEFVQYDKRALRARKKKNHENDHLLGGLQKSRLEDILTPGEETSAVGDGSALPPYHLPLRYFLVLSMHGAFYTGDYSMVVGGGWWMANE
jgi:hypothetical protein